MSWTVTVSDCRSPISVADAALAARYDRLAGETTGFIRATLLNLAAEARGEKPPARPRAETIDLHLVTGGTKSSLDAVRAYE